MVWEGIVPVAPLTSKDYDNLHKMARAMIVDIEAFTRREKMLNLREKLLGVEEDRLLGSMGCTPDEIDEYLNRIIADAERGKDVPDQDM